MEQHHLILKFSILSLTIIAAVAHSNYADGGPIIGIVSLPSDIDGYASDSYSYFPASYVKFVESGGARVIPIPYDLSQERILFLLERLNGVFFTGGDAAYFNEDGSFTHVATTLQFIVNYIVNKNSQGLYYPLWGTCQGFEAIACTLAGSFDVRTECMDCEVVNKYNYVNDDYQSRLLSLMPASLIEKMSYEKISYFAEYYKFGADLFESGGPLYEVLEPVTFAYDADGTKYVSSFESPTMPIYGTQFHQEKSTYEWHSLSPYNHSLDAVMLQQFLSDFFVQETWKNNNTFSDVSDYLIENFISNVVHDSGYSAVYMFPAQGSDNSDSESDGNDDDSTSGLSTSDSPAESSSTSSSSKDLDLNLTSNQQNQYSNTIHAYGMTIIFSMLLYFFN